MYYTYKSLVRYVFCKYFYPFSGCLSLLHGMFNSTEVLNFDIVNFICFSFAPCAFGSISKIMKICASFHFWAFIFFRSLIQLKFSFAYGVRKGSNISILYRYPVVWAPIFLKDNKQFSQGQGKVLHTSVFGEQFDHACLKWKYQNSIGCKC